MTIKRNLNTLRNILCFSEISKCGKMNHTASKHNMKQSNLSNIIKDLEEDLGTKLFTRTNSGMKLTDAGKELFEIACQLESVIYKTETFSTNVNKISGDIRLWVSDGLGAGAISTYLSDFYLQYPDVRIDFKCSIETPKMLHEADMAIVYEEPKFSEAIIIAKHTLKFGLFASTTYLSHFGYPKDLEELQKNHRICTRSNYANVWPQWAELIGKTKYISASTNSSSMLMKLTKDSVGVALHPISIGSAEEDLVHLSKIDFELNHPFWIISHKEIKDVPKVRALINHIKEASEKL